MSNINTLVENISDVYRKSYGDRPIIPMHEPSLKGRELEYVTDCIRTGWVSSVGDYVRKFADAVAQYSGAKYAVPTSTGTAALHLALLCAKVGPEDEVLCPDVTFVATAAAISYTGAKPVFLDVEKDTLGLSPVAVESFIREHTRSEQGKLINKKTGRRIAAVVPMHNVGFAGRIEALRSICEKNGLALVEDAAESLGVAVNGKMTGTFGLAGIFSFNGNKIVTTGGGGMIVTDSEAVYKRAMHLSTTAKVPHPFAYQHDDIGYNYRMPNINAALGLAQLERLDVMIATKRRQFEAIKSGLNDPALRVLEPPFGTHNYWFVVAQIKGHSTDTVVQELAKKGVMSRPLWSRISKMRPYASCQATENPVSEELSKTVICLPNGLA